MMVCFPTSPI